MSAAADYAARIDAVEAQQVRLRGGDHGGERWSAAAARRFRFDPRRRMDPNLTVIASFVEPEDVFVDVGGGAGRICLPLAPRCREVINVDPAAAMRAEFEQCARDAGITNARFVQTAWQGEHDVSGDVVFTANVTYFIRDIVPFIERMETAARRRVIVALWSVPPPVQDAALYRLVHNEPQEAVPGHQELLPVLWELGLLPDVRVLPHPFREGALPSTRDAAVDWALLRLREQDRPAVRDIIGSHFGELFDETPDGFRPLWRPDAREMLITWEPGQRH